MPDGVPTEAADEADETDEADGVADIVTAARKEVRPA
jgi:hypothetical protein